MNKMGNINKEIKKGNRKEILELKSITTEKKKFTRGIQRQI